MSLARSHCFALFPVIFALGAVGCAESLPGEEPGTTDPLSGGQTGDGTGAKGDDDQIPEIGAVLAPDCDFEIEEAEVSDETPLGFGAEDVLDFAEGPFESEILWEDGGEAPSFGPETQNGVRLSMEYSGGPIEVAVPVAGEDGVPPHCAALVRIPVLVDIQTGGGALDERFETVLHASSLELAWFDGIVNGSDLEGVLEPLSPDDSIDAVRIEGVVSPFGTRGSVGVRLEGGEGEPITDPAASSGLGEAELPVDELGGGFATVAHWPATNCEASEPAMQQPGILLDGDAQVGELSLDDAVERLTGRVPLHWLGDDSTELELSLTRTGGACLMDRFQGRYALGGPVQIEMSTIDGRLSANVTGDLSADADPSGALEFASVSVNLNSLSPERFSESVTLDGVDLMSQDSVSFWMSLSLDVREQSYFGSMAVSGSVTMECADAEADAEADEGLVRSCDDVSTLLDAEIGAADERE